eukprot:IDg5732t1
MSTAPLLSTCSVTTGRRVPSSFVIVSLERGHRAPVRGSQPAKVAGGCRCSSVFSLGSAADDGFLAAGYPVYRNAVG